MNGFVGGIELCEVCFAVIASETSELHAEWHRQMFALLQAAARNNAEANS